MSRSEIYNECERLVYRFLKVLEGEQRKTADLFTEDGEAFKHVGRETVREHFASIESVDDNVNVKLSSNLFVDVLDADHVRHELRDSLCCVTRIRRTDGSRRRSNWRRTTNCEIDHSMAVGD